MSAAGTMRMMIDLLAGVPADTRIDLSRQTARDHDSIERWISRIAWVAVAIVGFWDIAATFSQ
jgi:hypothetical protein